MQSSEAIVHNDVLAQLTHALHAAANSVLSQQRPDGHWCYELEADCTIPAEYILMMHYMDEIDTVVEQKLAVYLRARQEQHGGWPLYYGGEFDMSCSVKAYYALKLVGDSPNAAHMVAARQAILAHGGAAHSNVFTRITLALFEQVPWRAVPFIPVEILLLPRWFPFHVSKVSYWSRTVMVPLFVLCSLRGKSKNPKRVYIRELFIVPPEQETHYFEKRSSLNRVFLVLDKIGKMIEPLIPPVIRQRAVKKAESWCIERLNGKEGLGAIFPAMVNVFEMFALLGYAPDHECMVQARVALQRLLVFHKHEGYCQPCLSPVWDTGLAVLALQEADPVRYQDAITRGLDWLKKQQIVTRGDWADKRPYLPAGGWAFQYRNDHYPDLDDTALVAWAMQQANQAERYEDTIFKAITWLTGMQSSNGGFAAFDIDNTYYYLNEIPFADHGALLDPPTSDVTARVATLYGKRGQQDTEVVKRCLQYLYAEQERDGSWFGRWGTNYIYGTWSVLTALEALGEACQQPAIQRAVQYIKKKQNADGGWGEDNGSYFTPPHASAIVASTSFQTAWALLALMAAGEVNSLEVANGVAYLLRTQQQGTWSEPFFTCPGFPRVFYLKYHGYSAFFPLWALARYYRLQHGTL